MSITPAAITTARRWSRRCAPNTPPSMRPVSCCRVDCPDLAGCRHTDHQDMSEKEFLADAEKSIEALNAATADIPPEAMRMHICWLNYAGPHTHDIPVARLIGLVEQGAAPGPAVRGRKPAPRARVGGLESGEDPRKQGAGARRYRFDQQFRRASRSGRPSAFAAMPISLGVSVCLPGPTADLEHMPGGSGSTRRWSWLNSVRWLRAPGSQRSACGVRDAPARRMRSKHYCNLMMGAPSARGRTWPTIAARA